MFQQLGQKSFSKSNEKVSQWCCKSGPLKLIGQFIIISLDGTGCNTHVKFVITVTGKPFSLLYQSKWVSSTLVLLHVLSESCGLFGKAHSQNTWNGTSLACFRLSVGGWRAGSLLPPISCWFPLITCLHFLTIISTAREPETGWDPLFLIVEVKWSKLCFHLISRAQGLLIRIPLILYLNQNSNKRILTLLLVAVHERHSFHTFFIAWSQEINGHSCRKASIVSQVHYASNI